MRAGAPATPTLGAGAVPVAAATASAAGDVEIVLGGFRAVGEGDLAGFAARFHPDATWNTATATASGGVKAGVDAIVEFLRESMELTAGTLRPVPQHFRPDGAGRVAVLAGVSGTRPDGRAFDDTQVMVFRVEEGRVRVVGQFVGDPPAVTAFWA